MCCQIPQKRVVVWIGDLTLPIR